MENPTLQSLSGEAKPRCEVQLMRALGATYCNTHMMLVPNSEVTECAYAGDDERKAAVALYRKQRDGGKYAQ
jgi:hypothetical protein